MLVYSVLSCQSTLQSLLSVLHVNFQNVFGDAAGLAARQKWYLFTFDNVPALGSPNRVGLWHIEDLMAERPWFEWLPFCERYF